MKSEDYGASLKGSGVEGADVVATGASEYGPIYAAFDAAGDGGHSADDAREDYATAYALIEDLQRTIAVLGLGFCDEAYILMVQALDVKALGKGRRRILSEQALRMAKVGLREGWPRHSRHEDDGLKRRARQVIDELEGRAA